VAFEGLDGCGKSTQIRRLARDLEAAGHDVLATREPTDGHWGRRIREMARSGEPVTPEEELRWFVEDRRQHVTEVLAPALEFPAPDLVLLLEVEPEVGLERVRARGGHLETVFERRELLERVAEIFRSIDRAYLERVPAHGAPDEVHAAVRARTAARLEIP
jgi:dTMP kinase